jgi:hypothetical protein
MDRVSSILFDSWLAPLAGLSRETALLGLALLTGLAAVAIFRVSSRPGAIVAARDRAVARLLELWLFRDDPWVSLGAFGRVLAANAAYLVRMLPPMLASALPIGLLMVQAHDWFAGRPLQPGESALVVARWTAAAAMPAFSLAASDGLAVETPAVRSQALRETAWRVRRTGPPPDRSAGWVEIGLPGQATVRKSVALADDARCPPRRVTGSWAALLYPGEPRLPAGGSLEFVEVRHPEARYGWGRWRAGWLTAWLGLALLAGFAFRKPVGAEF